MKTFFGLLLLSGVLAAQDPEIIQKAPCQLLVSDLVGDPRMSSIAEMKSSALNALQRFLKSQNVDIYSVVCVTVLFLEGYLYQVQYNGYNWVKIYIPLSGQPQIFSKGVIL